MGKLTLPRLKLPEKIERPICLMMLFAALRYRATTSGSSRGKPPSLCTPATLKSSVKSVYGLKSFAFSMIALATRSASCAAAAPSSSFSSSSSSYSMIIVSSRASMNSSESSEESHTVAPMSFATSYAMSKLDSVVIRLRDMRLSYCRCSGYDVIVSRLLIFSITAGSSFVPRS